MSIESVLTRALTPWQDNELAGWTRPGAEGAPAVHILHGNGFCATTLLPMAQQLPADWSLLLTDVPGHGRSQQPAHHMPDWLRMARRIGDGLASRSTVPVLGVGHSMGGVLTLMLAAERPQLFSRIVLLDPVLFSPEILLLQKMARKTGLWRRTALVKAVAARRRHWPDAGTMLADLQQKSLYRRWQPEALQAFVAGGSCDTAEGRSLCCDPAWEASIFGSYPRGLWQAVRRVEVPVDIVVASDSYGFIAPAARRAAAANPRIRVVPVEGSHCFPMEQPQQAAQIILNGDA